MSLKIQADDEEGLWEVSGGIFCLRMFREKRSVRVLGEVSERPFWGRAPSETPGEALWEVSGQMSGKVSEIVIGRVSGGIF